MAKGRRGRGEGGVRQRAEDGLWVGTVSLGYKADGKRDRRTVYAATKAECLAKLRTLQGHSPAQTTAGTVTVAAYLSRWLAADALHTAPRTHENRQSLARLHILPHLGQLKLTALTSARIAAWHATLAQAGVGPSAIKSAAVCLSSALSAAVSEGLVPVNVCKVARKPKEQHREMVTLTALQARELLAAADTKPVGPLVHLALGTGCRISELLALKWDDVELDTHPPTLAIRRSLTHTQTAGYATKVPKSQAGNRVIVLPRHAADALRRWFAHPLRDGTLVFATQSGKHQSRMVARRAVLRVLSSVPGLPAGFRLHDLRHTHASLLLSGGASIKAVARRLGHADAAVTLRVYAHCLPGDDALLAAQLDAQVGTFKIGDTQATVVNPIVPSSNAATPTKHEES